MVNGERLEFQGFVEKKFDCSGLEAGLETFKVQDSDSFRLLE